MVDSYISCRFPTFHLNMCRRFTLFTKNLILLRKPALSLLGQRSLSSDQTLNQYFLTQAQVALAHPLLIPAWLDRWRLRWR